MLYATTDAELIQWLSIYSQSPKVIYSVPIDTEQGDILQITSQFQVTNSHKYNVEVGSYIVYGGSSIDITGILLTKPTAPNVTPDMHHYKGVLARQWQMEYSFSGFINLVVYAAADSAKPGDMLEVNQGYGHLDVAIN